MGSMKLLHQFTIVFLFSIAASKSALAQEPNRFREYLQTLYPSCYTSDGAGGWIIDPDCPAVLQEDSLNFEGIFTGTYYEIWPISVVDLKYFRSLKYLNLSNNHILDIDSFPPNLDTLIMKNAWWSSPKQGPYFTSLPSTLHYLNCDSTFLSTISALPPGLEYLNLASNKLRGLPALPSSLDTLICNHQTNTEEEFPELFSLPALPAALRYLDCHSNALRSLPVLPAGLQYLDCSDQWTGLSAPGTWERTLRWLPALPASLRYLNCEKNRLTLLPALPASLEYLNCSKSRYHSPDYEGVNEGINKLPVLPTSLRILNCSFSNMDCLPHLPDSLNRITLDRNRILCLPNTGLFTVLPAGPVIPQCSATLTGRQCTDAAKIQGTVFYDANSNGVKDVGESFCSNVPIHLLNGVTTFTNSLGGFFLTAPLGACSVNAEVPDYLTAQPANFNYNFSSYDTTVNAVFALQPNRNYDSLNVKILASPAKPGLIYDLQVLFENVGTTQLNADLVVNYDSSKIHFTSASNASVAQMGNELKLRVENFAPRVPLSFWAHFNTPQAHLGDTIVSYATIVANALSNKDSVISVFRGAFDPNLKSATPVLTPLQVQRGTFINYLIQFQNTGTDTAYHVVVSDTLNQQLDTASFEMIYSSHNVRTTRDGNKLCFEFLQIQLPDSTTNEGQSHGYIKYRIKPQVMIPSGSTIPNRASIYFDFNEPVQTNQAQTLVIEPVVLFTTYHFIGNGLWNQASNWQGGIVPPAIITSGIQININPIPGGSCIVNVPVTINHQSNLVVASGAQLIVLGNLNISQ